MIHITNIARERTKKRLCKEVKGMDEFQREEYLSKVANTIDAMLNDYAGYLGTDNNFDVPIEDARYVKTHPFTTEAE